LFYVFKTALEDGGWGGSLDSVRSHLFLEALWRTVVLASVVACLSAVLGLVYSLALAITTGWLKGALLAMLFVSFSISVLVRTYGWVLLYQPNGVLFHALHALGLADQPLGILKTTAAMYPAMVHIMLPYMVLPLYASMTSLDPDHLKAGMSLGARPRLLFTSVVFPQIRGGLAAGWLLVFILSLGFYVTPAVLGGPSNLTLATVINQQFSQLFDFGSASAMGAAVLILVLAIYFLADRLLARAIGWQDE
jgi:ABC-type spermidine/putrescine transport system permease subunit I